jgi:hypothetical protein
MKIKKRWNLKVYLLLLVAFACCILLSNLVAGDPPTPHNIEGKISTNAGNGVQNGIPVFINNTVNGYNTIAYVDAPAIQDLWGIYSTTIEGNDGNLIAVWSWNDTNYGNNTANIEAGTTNVDVNLSFTRSSEANVTILSPLNNSLKNKSTSFNVTVNITMLGNDGIGCNAIISFSNNKAMNITQDYMYINYLGDMSLYHWKTINWTVFGGNEGVSNITISVICDSDGLNFEHLNSKTVYNITVYNFPPKVYGITVDNPIDLLAGDNLTVFCNASINESNGVADLRVVNATFYQVSYGTNANDDSNYHYSNSSCSNYSSSPYQSNYSCSFKLAYYTNNGTWQCNMSVFDNSNATDSGNITTFINELLAIEIDTLAIDYGNLGSDSSSQTDFNVTIKNSGNMPFNTSVRTYAPNESLAYLNLSMTCDSGNISNANQRFSVYNGSNFAEMIRLNNESQIIANFTRPQRTNEFSYGNDTNITYWKLQVPQLKAGICNGTVVFSAIPLPNY